MQFSVEVEGYLNKKEYQDISQFTKTLKNFIREARKTDIIHFKIFNVNNKMNYAYGLKLIKDYLKKNPNSGYMAIEKGTGIADRTLKRYLAFSRYKKNLKYEMKGKRCIYLC